MTTTDEIAQALLDAIPIDAMIPKLVETLTGEIPEGSMPAPRYETAMTICRIMSERVITDRYVAIGTLGMALATAIRILSEGTGRPIHEVTDGVIKRAAIDYEKG